MGLEWHNRREIAENLIEYLVFVKNRTILSMDEIAKYVGACAYSNELRLIIDGRVRRDLIGIIGEDAYKFASKYKGKAHAQLKLNSGENISQQIMSMGLAILNEWQKFHTPLNANLIIFDVLNYLDCAVEIRSDAALSLPVLNNFANNIDGPNEDGEQDLGFDETPLLENDADIQSLNSNNYTNSELLDMVSGNDNSIQGPDDIDNIINDNFVEETQNTQSFEALEVAQTRQEEELLELPFEDYSWLKKPNRFESGAISFGKKRKANLDAHIYNFGNSNNYSSYSNAQSLSSFGFEN